jgi:flagellar biosynthesis protein FliQ
MRARPNLTGEQIVTDYLTRVAQAARLLPKGARMAFVGRTRILVDREVGPPGTRTDPERVIEALTRLGKPEDLVMAERTRIDRGWVKSRASSKEEGEAAAAALTGPRMNRPLTARRRRPNSETQPIPGRPGQPAPGGTATAPDATAPDATAPDRTATGPDATAPNGTATAPNRTATGPDGTVTGKPGPAPDAGPRRPMLRSAGPRNADARPAGQQGTGATSAGPRGAVPRIGGPRRLRSADSPDAPPNDAGQQSASPQSASPQSASPQEVGPRGAEGPGTGAGDAGHTGPIDWLIGQVPGRRANAGGTETLTASAGRLARDNVLESVAILLLGLGGLILPLPFWPIGAVVAMFSRLWDIKDKTLAVVGPLLVILVASVLTAVFMGGTGNAILIYFHAIRVSFGLMVRVGSVLTAAYLAWRVAKGPRVKMPPWKRISR